MKVKTAGTVLAYNLTEEKRVALNTVCRKLGIRLKEVGKEDFDKPIGAMMGFSVGISSEADNSDVSFADEMLVLYNIAGTNLDKFLKALRAAEVTVTLKAVLTASNQGWLPHELCAELKKEHEQMSGK